MKKISKACFLTLFHRRAACDLNSSKIRIFSLIALSLLFAAILSLSVLAQNTSKISEVKILLDSSGMPMQMVMSGYVKEKTAWLGYSFYPKVANNYINEGKHKVEPLKEGNFFKAPFIDRKFIGGTYEIALWSKKVDKKDCSIKGCKWCAKNGFHMEGRLDYTWGYITAKK